MYIPSQIRLLVTATYALYVFTNIVWSLYVLLTIYKNVQNFITACTEFKVYIIIFYLIHLSMLSSIVSCGIVIGIRQKRFDLLTSMHLTISTLLLSTSFYFYKTDKFLCGSISELYYMIIPSMIELGCTIASSFGVMFFGSLVVTMWNKRRSDVWLLEV